MKFDKVKIVDCATPPTGTILTNTPGGGGTGGDGGGGGGGGGGDHGDPADPCQRSNSGTTDDQRCQDPSFAQANPGLCLSAPRLILKPGVIVAKKLESIQFTAFLFINGEEEELTEGLTFQSSDQSVLVIGPRSGSATGVQAGIATISVEYGGISAFAQVNVVAECGTTSNAFFMIFDDSKSMSSNFSTLKGSRIQFATSMGAKLTDSLDYAVDEAAIVFFDQVAGIKASLMTDPVELRRQIQTIGPTQKYTSILDGLKKAKEMSDAAAWNGRNVIVLFTDGGENQNEVVDLVNYAQQLRNDGWIIMVVGMRAAGRNFRLLETIATGGFFINAIESNQNAVLSLLVQLKFYVCSGCKPVSTIRTPSPALNFQGFQHWDVPEGHVDLIGKSPNGVGMFDLLPGNGFYIDLAGSSDATPQDLGQLWSKQKFTWVTGHNYTLKIKLAGNQREERSGDTVQIKIFGATGGTFVIQTVTINDWKQDFTEYSFPFTPGADDDGVEAGKIAIIQLAIGGVNGVYGTLLNDIVLTDNTTGEILLSDNFDNENLQDLTFPNVCLDASIGSYGGGGTTDVGNPDPIPPQVPDPKPLIDEECRSVVTKSYSSTRSYTATCVDGTGDDVTKTATASSEISQEDADTKALAAATAAATAALVCAEAWEVGEICNISFNLYFVGGYTPMQGPAVVGESGSDYWNEHAKDGWNMQTSAPASAPMKLHNGKILDSTIEAKAGFSWVNTPPDESIFSRLLQSWAEIYPEDAKDFTFRHVPAGTYDLYIYGHGSGDDMYGSYTVQIGSDPDDENGPFDTDTMNTEDWKNPPFRYQIQYIKYAGIVLNGTDDLLIRIEENAAGKWIINGIQLKRVA